MQVVSTLAEFHLCHHLDASKGLEIIARILDKSSAETNGLVGFAPGIEPDLDDSAKASIIMSLSGKAGFSKAIVKEFDTPRSLKTYRGERNPSVSANCNALLSLLVDRTEFEGKAATIKKIVAFIFDSWAEGKGEIKDKWVRISRNLTVFFTA
jgi:hypothetical protein